METIKKISNKEDVENIERLAIDEIDKTNFTLSVLDYLQILIWKWFCKYRLVYFCRRVLDGMHVRSAFSDAESKEKGEIMYALKLRNWE